MQNSRFIDIHTHTQHPGITAIVSYEAGSGRPFPDAEYVSAGVHPWDAETVDIDKAVSFLRSANLVAIGEIGLDFARDTDRRKQEDVFRIQLEIAAERKLPVIIHCVRAYNEVLRILSQFELKAVIFHGYIGGVEQTKTITDRGYYISIGERSLRSDKTVEALRHTPVDRLFAETDTSDISIENIYNAIADIKKIEVALLKELIYNNFKKITG